MKSAPTWIDPKAIDSVQALEWFAKVFAKGFLHGKHTSTKVGTGMEFKQYRPYSPGDDIRLIDWKKYAKSEKYYIRQSDIETDHRLLIYMDNSPSMAYEEKDISKLLLGKIITACITYILNHQGDQFSWLCIDGHRLPFGTGNRHWQSSLHQLYDLYPHQEDEVHLPPADHHLIYLWITDLYDNIDHIHHLIKGMKHADSELIIFHLMGKQEENLNFTGNTTFVDLESGEKMQVNAKKYKNTYQTSLNDHFTKVENLCFKHGVFYQKAYLHQPVEKMLKTFFDRYNYLSAL